MNKNQQVDLPLVFFFVAFCIILFGLLSKFTFQKGTEIKGDVKENKNIKLKNLNYNNPIQCSFIDNTSSVSAQLEGTSIAVEVKSTKEPKKIMVIGDCMYSWDEIENKGKKQCGIGQFVSMGKQLLSTGLASADSLSAIAKRMGKNIPFDIGAILESCNNVKEVRKGVFVLPKNIMFK